MTRFWIIMHAAVLVAVIVMALIMLHSPPAGAQELASAGTPVYPVTFWQEGLASLAQWPLEISYNSALRQVQFTGWEGERCTAILRLPAQGKPYGGAVLHIGGPETAVGGEGLVHLFINCDPAHPRGAYPSAEQEARNEDLDLYQGVLNARQALAVLNSLPGLTPGKTGVVGEGLGATEAMVLAALCPGEVTCVAEYLPEGAEAKATSLMPQVRVPLRLLGPEAGSREQAMETAVDWIRERLGGAFTPGPTLRRDEAAQVRLVPGLGAVDSGP